MLPMTGLDFLLTKYVPFGHVTLSMHVMLSSCIWLSSGIPPPSPLSVRTCFALKFGVFVFVVILGDGD
jgi:hypothetical protein